MQLLAWEKDDLILPGSNRLIAAIADVIAVLQVPVVNAKLPAFELTRFAMEEVHKCEVPVGDALTSVVVMEAEEIAIIAGRDLSFHTRNGEFLHPKSVQHLWQRRLNAGENHVLLFAQLHQHARAPEVIVDHALLHAGRVDLAGLKVSLMV